MTKLLLRRLGQGVLVIFVLETITFMRREIENRRTQVDCEWQERPLPLIDGDPKQLKQAFFNIIKNALQAMTGGGTLRIAGFADEEFLTLEFSDGGKGITADELTGLFVPFHTTKATGNGLGMMIIERVCREHGAEFGVESLPDKGTCVSLRFPLGGKRMRVLPS